jgi:hypothetical protein
MKFPMRDYDNAISRLETLSRYLDAEGREERLAKLQISIKGEPGQLQPPSAFVESVETLIRAELQRLGARVIHAAQDEVRKAAEVLRASIDDDLKSNVMRDYGQ